LETPTRHLTADDYARARRLLMRRDPVLCEIIKRYGACRLAEASTARSDPFLAIVRAITGQQLSTKAGATIYARFCALFSNDGPPRPHSVALVSDEQLRTIGLSGQKVRYVRDLCAKVADGSLPLDRLPTLPDEEVIEALTRVKGLGRWSGEMYLMFRLQRPDVLPVDDLGIVKAVQKLYRLRKPPKPARILKIGEAWRPYRSVASWYLWRSLDSDPVQTVVGPNGTKP